MLEHYLILFVVLSVIVALIAHLAAIDVIPRNPRLGLRIPSLMASDPAWRAGHAAIRPWSVASIAATGVAAVYAPSDPTVGYVSVGVFFVTHGAALYAARRAAGRAT